MSEKYVGQPFNGDTGICAAVLALRKKHVIRCAIETGTYRGDTTAWLAQHFATVHTIDVDRRNEGFCRERFAAASNVMRHYGDSPDVLRDLLPTLPAGPVLFFLDAHWYKDWPILRELIEISQHAQVVPIILIHDFKVNGLGFDSYEGKDLDMDYVRPALQAVYPSGYNAWTNSPSTATGACRGALYVEPEEVSE